MGKKLPVLVILLVSVSCHSPRNTSSDKFVSDRYHYTTKKTLTCSNGAVVSAHPLASEVGLNILKQGGNAVDAAIATQLALAVVYPRAGNIGGGGFMVARFSDGKKIALDYREMAPLHASRDMYIDVNGNARTDQSQDGHLASGVPGTVRGLFEASAYGKLSFSKLIQPAIDLAEKGFGISSREADSYNSLQLTLRKYNTQKPVFERDKPWQAGDTLIQTDLAHTLTRIRDKGAAGFYEGETARLIVEEMKRGGGIINYDDLKNYSAKFREPHVFSYRGYSIIGMPMPSSGGLLLNQMLKMIESRDIGAMGFQSEQATQLMTEVERRAFADRGKYMGDADFYKVPVKILCSEAYLREKMKDYDPDKVSPSKEVQPGRTQSYESEETTHFNVVDKDGNMVAVTTTLNNSYGNGVVVGGAGFFMNDEMDDFSIKPGVPNMYGAIGGEANAIEPGKRMLSSMTPTLVLKDEEPFLVVGTPGGTTIPTSVFQTIVNIIDFRMPAEDAVNKPKFHHQWLPDTLELETGFPADTRAGLENMGYAVKNRSAIGRTEAIKISSRRDAEGKKIFSFEAVADRRGDDAAEGY
ncbi:MAG TPA: gamma-glutamyltransferase [Chitinophagaceae bacterium]|nr:gamma-glutamyltransferase [Chitinophagaceae bacterium]